MLDIYEQPWTLVGLAVIVLFVVFTIRSVFPEKRRLWQLLIPVLIVTAAFGIDALVQTDKEKIVAVLDAGMQAVEDENFNAIYPYLSDDYSDTMHSSKQQLIDHAQSRLDINVVKKCKKTGSLITISQNKAKVNLFMHIILSEDSPVNRDYQIPFFQLKVDIDFIKQNEDWLIEGIEIKSVNKQSAKWNDIR
ncbi:MAG: hypothetical protein JXA96_03575 [Sedimentisphaerales bacterium]|nr:hypothetical protein [Sedimentisphaerales bacterium]